jgi:hypothetical protein
MKNFERAFIKHLTEDNLSGAGGVFGDADSMGHGGAIGMTDFYASGDARTPTGGKFEPCSHCKQRAKCKKAGRCLKSDDKTPNGSIKPFMPTQRRPLNRGM